MPRPRGELRTVRDMGMDCQHVRILMLAPHPDVSGPLPKTTPLLECGLRELGCEVTTLGWGRHADRESLAARWIGRVHDAQRVCNRARRERYNIVVVHTSHDWVALARDLPLLLAIRGLRVPIVVQFHGGYSNRLSESGHWAFKAASWALLRLSSGVLVLSSEEQRDLTSFSSHASVQVVKYAIQPCEGVNGRAARALDPDGVPTLLFVGRLIRGKGIFETLDAFAGLSRATPCRLVIAGAGVESHALRVRARELGISERVAFLGYVTGDALEHAYRTADVLVLPTYWGEGFPTVILEAMRAGLPVVATPTRGIADHLVDGVNVLFVPPRSAPVLREALQRILWNPSLREAMGRANLDKIREFTPRAAALAYLEALRAVLPVFQLVAQP